MFKLAIPVFVTVMAILVLSVGVITVNAQVGDVANLVAKALMTTEQLVVENLIDKGAITGDKIEVARDMYALKVNLKVGGEKNITISYKSTTTISWNAENAKSCWYSVNGGKSYSENPVALHKTITSAVLSTTTVYAVKCYNEKAVAKIDISTVTVGSQNAPTVSLQAVTANVGYSQIGNLSWTTTGAKSCKLDSVATALNNTAYKTKALTADTEFTLTCLNEQGQSASAKATITVNQPGGVLYNSFSATPATVNQGDKTKLTWTTTNAASCVLKDLTASTEKVVPTNSTVDTSVLYRENSYQLVCKNAANVSNSSEIVKVAVTGVNNITSFDAAPLTMNYNQSAKLNWVTSNITTGCTLDRKVDGVVTRTNTVGVNSITAGYSTGNLLKTTTFVLTCKNKAGESSSAEKTVTVTQPAGAVVNITANDVDETTNVGYGETATIAWNSINATSCNVKGGAINKTSLSGEFAMNSGALFATTYFEISCKNAAGVVVTDKVTVMVTPLSLPTVIFKVATSSKVNYFENQITTDYNTSVNLQWVARGTVESCKLNGVGISLLGGKDLLNLKANSTQTLVCYNKDGGQTTKNINIVVLPQTQSSIVMKVNGLSAETATVDYQKTATLSWTTTGAKSCKINGVATTINTNAYITKALATNTEFTLTCLNEQGLESTAKVTVNVTQPGAVVYNTFSATPSTVNQGIKSKLSWNTTNAVTCVLKDITAGTEKAVIASSTTDTLALYKDNSYQLVCKNKAGVATNSEIVKVTVTEVKDIVSFEATPAIIGYNQSAKLNWVTSNITSSCNISRVVGDVWGAPVVVPLNSATTGYSTGNLTETTTFSLACKSKVGELNGELRTITVNPPTIGLPTISFSVATSTERSSSAPATVAVNRGSSATLSWSVRGVVNNCYLNGAATTLANNAKVITNITTGSTQTLRCTNTAGGEASKAITITVNP